MQQPTTFFAAPASAGGLPGHGFKCGQCGGVQTTSLGEREAKLMAAKHSEWHASKAGK